MLQFPGLHWPNYCFAGPIPYFDLLVWKEGWWAWRRGGAGGFGLEKAKTKSSHPPPPFPFTALPPPFPFTPSPLLLDLIKTSFFFLQCIHSGYPFGVVTIDGPTLQPILAGNFTISFWFISNHPEMDDYNPIMNQKYVFPPFLSSPLHFLWDLAFEIRREINCFWGEEEGKIIKKKKEKEIHKKRKKRKKETGKKMYGEEGGKGERGKAWLIYFLFSLLLGVAIQEKHTGTWSITGATEAYSWRSLMEIMVL